MLVRYDNHAEYSTYWETPGLYCVWTAGYQINTNSTSVLYGQYTQPLSWLREWSSPPNSIANATVRVKNYNGIIYAECIRP
jgi:hypothetical protein